MPQNPWMVYSDTGLSLTERAEALRLVAYPDQGYVYTIGYGHTLGVYKGMVITAEQAVDYLRMGIRQGNGKCRSSESSQRRDQRVRGITCQP